MLVSDLIVNELIFTSVHREFPQCMPFEERLLLSQCGSV